jgi:hypothetical protein
MISWALGFLGPYSMQQWSGRHIPCWRFQPPLDSLHRFRCLESKPCRQGVAQIFREYWQTTIACNNADGAQMALVTTGIPLADKPLTAITSPNNGCCLRTIPGFACDDLWPSVLARNPRPQVFSPPLCGFLADASLQKTCVLGSSTVLRPNKVQAAGGGHLRSRIAGEWFPSEHPIGDFK